MILLEQGLGDRRKEKLPFNRMKPPVEKGSQKGSCNQCLVNTECSFFRSFISKSGSKSIYTSDVYVNISCIKHVHTKFAAFFFLLKLNFSTFFKMQINRCDQSGHCICQEVYM